jgi:choline dehydrogenase
MAHIRGPGVVDRPVAAGGAAGWGFADLLPYFRHSEHAEGRDPSLRGIAGPVQVAAVPGPDRHPVAVAFAQALLQLGCPASDDLSGSQQDGVAWPDLAIAAGQRVGPADAYLTPALHRPT